MTLIINGDGGCSFWQPVQADCVICIDDNTLCSFFLVAEDRVQNYSGVGLLLSGLELRNITHGTTVPEHFWFLL